MQAGTSRWLLTNSPCSNWPTCKVCRLFLELVEQSIQLQYKLELALAGMEDEPSCNLSFATKLEKLRALQESWRDLKLSPGPSIPFTEHGLWSFSGGLYAAVNPAGDLNFVQIPCRIRGTEERRWTIDGTDIGIPVTYMRIDQAQDLLVLLEAVEDRTNTRSVPFVGGKRARLIEAEIVLHQGRSIFFLCPGTVHLILSLVIAVCRHACQIPVMFTLFALRVMLSDTWEDMAFCKCGTGKPETRFGWVQRVVSGCL